MAISEGAVSSGPVSGDASAGRSVAHMGMAVSEGPLSSGPVSGDASVGAIDTHGWATTVMALLGVGQ